MFPLSPAARATLLAALVCSPPIPARGATTGRSLLPTRSCPAELRVTWTPERPRAGTLFLVRVAGAAYASPSAATFAGEPLHFDSAGRDSAVAFAAMPIDSLAGATLRLDCAAGGDGEVLRRPISAATKRYPVERLRVAPRFSAPPDSALSARQRDEAARAAAVSRMSHETPRLWRSPFIGPRPSRITSAFGDGREFNGTVTSRHMGTDFAGATGAPIRAANRGVVRLVADFYLGGNVVYVDHGEGVVTAYLHMSRQLVAEGDSVERGAIIGRVGATGRVTGPHLHFIARFGAITVDPMSLIALTAEKPGPGRASRSTASQH